MSKNKINSNTASTKHEDLQADGIRERISAVALAQAEYDTPFGTFLTYVTFWCLEILILPIGSLYGLWLYSQAQSVDPTSKKYRGIAIFSVIALAAYILIVFAMIIAWKLGYVNINW